MKSISLNQHAPIISDEISGAEILKEIQDLLTTEDIVSIDMNEIKSMATFCSKQIFGKLYLELGAENFFNRIEIKNATDNVKTIIRIGIESVL